MTVTRVLSVLTESRKMNVVWVVMAVLFCAFSVFYPLTDTDIWWHLAAGREMGSDVQVLHNDPFAYSIDRAPWINVHWVFQVLTHAVFSHGGALSLIVLKCAVIGISCLLLIFAIPGKRIFAVSAIICSLLMFSARYLIDVRPIILTLLYMSLFIFFLERYGKNGKLHYLLLLLPVQILWVNSQGLFALGLAIILIYTAGNALEFVLKGRIGSRQYPDGSSSAGNNVLPLLIAAGAATAVSLVNPYGMDILAYPAKLLGRITPVTTNIFSGNISENAPLFTLWNSPIGRGYVLSTLFALILGVVSFVFNASKMRLSHVLLFVAFFVLAIMAERNIVLFLFVSIPVCAWNFANADYERIAGKLGVHDRRPVMLFLIAISLAMLLGNVFKHMRDGVLSAPAGTYISPFSVPSESVEYLKAHPVEGRVFNSIRNGGFLAWEMFPSKQVYIDSRLMIRNEGFFQNYLALLEDPRGFDSLQEQFAITHAVLPTAPFRRDVRLVKHLYYENPWRLVYADGFQTVFVVDSLASTPAIDLDNPVTADSIAASLEARWEKSPYVKRSAVRYLMHLCTYLGAEESAQTLAVRLAPPDKRKSFVR